MTLIHLAGVRSVTCYEGCAAALSTQHGKQSAIAPVFSALTGIDVRVPDGIDTDQLGTFTGEIARPASMRDTARLKAIMGMKASGLAVGIASEGSFGPHPVIPFLPADREMMIFIDSERGLEVVEEQISEATNFDSLELAPGADMDGFLSRIGFPRHAVIFRCDGQIFKGITSRDVLDQLVRDAAGQVRLETDMRAHLNPTRMAEIAKLAEKLARRIATACPACEAPGFGPDRVERGLPCADCGAPTSLVRHVLSACSLCGHVERGPRTDGREAASPAECQECNP